MWPCLRKTRPCPAIQGSGNPDNALLYEGSRWEPFFCPLMTALRCSVGRVCQNTVMCKMIFILLFTVSCLFFRKKKNGMKFALLESERLSQKFGDAMLKYTILFVLTLAALGGCVRQGAEDNPSPTQAAPVALAQDSVHTSLAGDGLATPLALPQAWQVSPGLLRGQLESWAAVAGYQVVWKVSRDYHMQTNATFNGTFVEALQQLFNGMQKLGNSFKVTVYHGNRVVVVSEE